MGLGGPLRLSYSSCSTEEVVVGLHCIDRCKGAWGGGGG